jgi:ribosomal protein S27E
MNKFKSNKAGQYRPNMRLQGVIWMIGIAILAATNEWWPGIMILILVSWLATRLFDRKKPEADVDSMASPQVDTPAQNQVNYVSAPQQDPRTSAIQPVSMDWLPVTCPKCGGPLNAQTVNRTSDYAVTCPFCGTGIKKP